MFVATQAGNLLREKLKDLDNKHKEHFQQYQSSLTQYEQPMYHKKEK